MGKPMRGIENKQRARKWLVVHGHFYQPPRENPWLNCIEEQSSAAPQHDWNERIYAQCYRPNGFSRLLDDKGMIAGIHNNYSRMSFNFGPTLLSWLEQHHPVTTNRIVEADRQSAAANDGHGNAIAQVYNHMIMPLASRRDQITQIRWAKYAFKRSFGRNPEGIWLAETAINMETVQCLIEEKITFVVLSPNQAEAFRSLTIGHAPWTQTSSQMLDTRRPYRIFARNPAGKKVGGHLDVFFFDEGLSKEVSFSDMLQDAHTFGSRVNACYTDDSEDNQLVVLATDGETFGHHKPFGDMCLAYFFTHVAPDLAIQPVNFGHYLALYQPKFEVILKNANGEGTAWSCSHGVGRWARDCGCKTGGEEQWTQTWRAPLREALDNLQEQIDEAFTVACETVGVSPWRLRDRYIAQVPVASWKKMKLFLQKQFGHQILSREEVFRFRRLLEAQKYMLFSYTSCGWFFSELSGIEPMQNLAYACRALQLGIEPAHQQAVLSMLLKDLAEAPSNLHNDTGASLFKRHILPFYNHEAIIAFTVAFKQVLGIETALKYTHFGYAGEVAMREKGTSDGQTTFQVSLVNEGSGELSSWEVTIDLARSSMPRGQVVPISPAENLLSTSKALQSHAIRLKLTDLFVSSRGDLTRRYQQKFASHSKKLFEKWLQQNEHDLMILKLLQTSLPPYYREPLTLAMQTRWDNAMEKLAQAGYEQQCSRELVHIKEQSDRYGITIDLVKSARICEERVVDELKELVERLSVVRCDQIRIIMAIIETYGLNVAKHCFEDIFYSVLTKQVAPLYQLVKQQDKATRGELSSEKKLLAEVLQFALRMNFNTDEFTPTY